MQLEWKHARKREKRNEAFLSISIYSQITRNSIFFNAKPLQWQKTWLDWLMSVKLKKFLFQDVLRVCQKNVFFNCFFHVDGKAIKLSLKPKNFLRKSDQYERSMEWMNRLLDWSIDPVHCDRWVVSLCCNTFFLLFRGHSQLQCSLDMSPVL